MSDIRRVKVGDTAPDFELKDHKGNTFKLSENRGRTILLSFHPLAWTKVCALQMQSLEKSKETLDDLDAVAMGISVDSQPSKKAWAEELDVEFTPLMCDFWPHGGMIRRYGIFRGDDGFSERANVIVDPQGKIAFVKVYPIKELPDIDEVLGEIGKIER